MITNKNYIFLLLILNFTNFLYCMDSKEVAEYAIYAAPHEIKDDFLITGNPQWGGIHITLVGFSKENKDLRKVLKEITEAGKKSTGKCWSINLNKTAINNKTIILESNTLNKIAELLSKNKFSKIKGPVFAKYPWHITFVNQLPTNIIDKIKSLEWDIVIIKKENKIITWRERYPIYNIAQD